jgi:hypothetical protein
MIDDLKRLVQLPSGRTLISTLIPTLIPTLMPTLIPSTNARLLAHWSDCNGDFAANEHGAQDLRPVHKKFRGANEQTGY